MNLVKYLAPSSAPSFTYRPDDGTCSCATVSRTSRSDDSSVLILILNSVDHKTDSLAIKVNQAQSKSKLGTYLIYGHSAQVYLLDCQFTQQLCSTGILLAFTCAEVIHQKPLYCLTNTMVFHPRL